ncbi:MAG: hypothetical protein KUG69_11285 [Marinosulfonomonas sp.]|nr:hypothetical protein [Marinosulfonomonas sp.]
MKIPYILIAVAGLSACSGGTSGGTASGTTPLAGGVSGTTGGSTQVGTAHGVANGQPVAMTIGGTTITGLVRDTTYDKGVLKSFVQSEIDVIAGGSYSNREAGHTGVSSTGAMSASVMNTDFTSTEAGGIQRAASYARVSGGTMPTTGSATFTGDYAGGMGASNISAFIITGDVSLSADFGASTISGNITNRVGGQNIVVPGASSFEDVALGATAIGADGSFSGATTGGQFADLSIVGAVTSNNGTYDGLIGGATGSEAAGAINLLINYDNGGTVRNTTEVGVFIAE